MRLTRQSEIAIGILSECAFAGERTLQTRELAVSTNTTKAHAAQAVALLVRHGLLVSQRGRNGGVRLGVEADAITLARVIEITQPELMRCAEATLNPGADRVGLIVEASFALFSRLMRRFTIADLVATGDPAPVPCLDRSLIVSTSERMTPARRHDQGCVLSET